MKRLLLFVLLSLPAVTFAQSAKQQVIRPYSSDEAKEAKKEGESLIKSLNYTQALPIFQRLVITDPKDAETNFRLGLCYLNTNADKSKAVSYLEYAANANTKEKFKDIQFELGKAYHYAHLYDKALETFEKFRVEKKGLTDPKLKFNQWVDWSVNAKKLTATPLNCTFTNMGKGINSNSADYKPVMGAADTIIYFSSKRKGNTGGLTDDLGDIPSDIYFFTQNDTARSKAKNLGTNVNTAFYEECMFVNANGDKMLVYREGPESNGDIYIAELKGKQFNAPVSAGKEFVSKPLETGASLSPDGMTMYFAAELNGSKTGKDIFKCTRTESTSWSKPERLPDVINTSGDEDNPMMWMDGKTFFFSSTGHNSMGGADIFRAELKDERAGFSTPENIGYPLNTEYDETSIALSADGKTMYTSAVRDSGLGDYDIYKVTTDNPVSYSTLTWVEGRTLAPGGGPAKDAIVIVTNTVSGATVANLESNDANGRFDLALPAGTYKVSLRHAKLGKGEAQLVIDPATESKQVLDVKFE